jgi:mRNA interferase RelE/StbE
MIYRLVYTRRAERDIKKLEPKTKDRIGKALLRYSEEPLRFAEKLSDPILGEYRFRIGDYRVIFDVEGDDNSPSPSHIHFLKKSISHFLLPFPMISLVRPRSVIPTPCRFCRRFPNVPLFLRVLRGLRER